MRLLVIAGGLAAAMVLFLLLRPGDDETASPTRATTAPAPPAAPTATPTPATASMPAETTPPPPPPPTPPPPNSNVVSIRITIREGRPEGGLRRATVKRGRRVRLVVRSDVADHVHLHGYDVFRDVGPGKPAQLAFRATLTGRFEIELEDRGLQFAELEVRP